MIYRLVGRFGFAAVLPLFMLATYGTLAALIGAATLIGLR